jgi:hypothetical protein
VSVRAPSSTATIDDAPRTVVPGLATLPANPFEEITADALESFVDCTLYEDRAASAPAGELGALEETAAALPAPPPAPSFEPSAPPPLRTVRPSARSGVPMALLTAICTSVLVVAGGWFLLRQSPPASTTTATAASADATAKEAAPSPSSAPSTTAAAPTPSAPPSDAASVAAASAPPPTATPAPLPVAEAAGPCLATVKTGPPGADVTWNDRPLGRTPLVAVHVPCGEARLWLLHPEFRSVERRVVAHRGPPVPVYVALERPPALLDLTSTPPGATFTVAGRRVGTSPTTTQVAGFGEVVVVATLPGYKPWSGRVRVTPPQATFHVDLVRLGRH